MHCRVDSPVTVQAGPRYSPGLHAAFASQVVVAASHRHPPKSPAQITMPTERLRPILPIRGMTTLCSPEASAR